MHCTLRKTNSGVRMQITQVCKKYVYRDTVGVVYIRQQMSNKAVRSVSAATMAVIKI